MRRVAHKVRRKTVWQSMVLQPLLRQVGIAQMLKGAIEKFARSARRAERGPSAFQRGHRESAADRASDANRSEHDRLEGDTRGSVHVDEAVDLRHAADEGRQPGMDFRVCVPRGKLLTAEHAERVSRAGKGCEGRAAGAPGAIAQRTAMRTLTSVGLFVAPLLGAAGPRAEALMGRSTPNAA